MNDLGLLRFGTTPQLSRNAMARGVGNRLRSLGAPGNRARLRDVSMAGTVMVGFVIGLAQALGRAEAGTDNILYWHDTGNGLAYPAQWMISSSWWVYPPPLGQSLEFINPIGFPAYLKHMGLVARDELGIEPKSLGIKSLIVHLGVDDRDALEKLWGADVYDTYGCNECGTMAS